MVLAAPVAGLLCAKLIGADREKVKMAEERLRRVNVEWRNASSEWDNKAGPKLFDEKLSTLRERRRSLEELPALR